MVNSGNKEIGVKEVKLSSVYFITIWGWERDEVIDGIKYWVILLVFVVLILCFISNILIIIWFFILIDL